MTKTTAVLTMDELLAQNEVAQIRVGDVIDGTILSIKKHELWLDIGAFGIGVVMRREMGHTVALEEGQTLTVSVVDPEFEDGYALLSLRKAAKDRASRKLARQSKSTPTMQTVAGYLSS